MQQENLATYLNDHLAGSVAGLGLLDHMIETTASTPHAPFFRTLRTEVAADQEVLRSLLEKISASESMVRKAGGWLMEKLAWVKMRIDTPSRSALERMETLEALLLGITGKRALWQALGAANVAMVGVDLASLIGRADQQIAVVDAKRLEAAREAFAQPDAS